MLMKKNPFFLPFLPFSAIISAFLLKKLKKAQNHKSLIIKQLTI
jgi:hypothetical protein